MTDLQWILAAIALLLVFSLVAGFMAKRARWAAFAALRWDMANLLLNDHRHEAMERLERFGRDYLR